MAMSEGSAIAIALIVIFAIVALALIIYFVTTKNNNPNPKPNPGKVTPTCPADCGNPATYPTCVSNFKTCVNDLVTSGTTKQVALTQCGDKVTICFANQGTWPTGTNSTYYSDSCDPYSTTATFPVTGCNYDNLYTYGSYTQPTPPQPTYGPIVPGDYYISASGKQPVPCLSSILGVTTTASPSSDNIPTMMTFNNADLVDVWTITQAPDGNTSHYIMTSKKYNSILRLNNGVLTLGGSSSDYFTFTKVSNPVSGVANTVNITLSPTQYLSTGYFCDSSVLIYDHDGGSGREQWTFAPYTH